MVGAEWRKAGRVYDALKEKIKTGVYLNDSSMDTQLFAAWDQLPPDFRDRIEKRIFNRQYDAVYAKVNSDLETKTALYDQKIKDYRAAEQAYAATKVQVEEQKNVLKNMEKAIKMGMALREFCKAIGIEQNIQWW